MRASLLGRLGGVVLLSAALLIPMQPAFADDGGVGQSQPVSPALLEQATAYLRFRNSAIVSLDAAGAGLPMMVPTIPMTSTFTNDATEAWQSQATRRVRLAGKGVRYAEARTQVEPVSAVTTAHGLDVTVYESTELVFARVYGDEPPFTAYHMEVVLSYVPTTSGGWALAGSRAANEESLLPPTMPAPKTYLKRSAVPPVEPVEVPTAGGGDPIKVHVLPPDVYLPSPVVDPGTIVGPQVEILDPPGTSEEECGEAGACTADDQVNVSMKFPPSLTIGNVEVAAADGEYKELLLALDPPQPDDRPAGLDYKKMLEYAVTHYEHYNPDFRRFDNDCTNFISQIMRTGGWKHDTGHYKNNGNWWYNRANQTYTWAGAENWSQFAPRRTMHLDNVWKMVRTDILQMDFDRNNNMNHSMVVTHKDSHDRYLTYHTENHLNRSLREIIDSYSGAWYYAYRT